MNYLSLNFLDRLSHKRVDKSEMDNMLDAFRVDREEVEEVQPPQPQPTILDNYIHGVSGHIDILKSDEAFFVSQLAMIQEKLDHTRLALSAMELAHSKMLPYQKVKGEADA